MEQENYLQILLQLKNNPVIVVHPFFLMENCQKSNQEKLKVC